MTIFSPSKSFNPFYLLVTLVGVAFCVTAFAYGVMTVRGLQPDIAVEASRSGQRMMEWLDAQGFRLMMGELGLLAICTVAAIATDEYWQRKKGG